MFPYLYEILVRNEKTNFDRIFQGLCSPLSRNVQKLTRPVGTAHLLDMGRFKTRPVKVFRV